MIYCIIGKSASGKDTIYKKIINKIPNINKITLYTTRPKRENEKEGIEYFFVNEDFLKQNKNKIIEQRTYNTIYGPWIYAMIDDGSINSKNNYLLLSTLESYNSIKKYFGEENVFPIYINVPNDIRLQRAKDRVNILDENTKKEIERRFKADEIDFSTQKIKEANITKIYDNANLQNCINEIYNDIMETF
ncbi:MAG: guanylate kinase [Eubacteriales bacterium]|nr:guanylate kinase [Eubacteriales bacterium]